MSISTPQRPSSLTTDPTSAQTSSSQRRSFPGWRWMAVWRAFPVAGYIGWKIGGRGALTGAGLAAVQWWAAKGALRRPAAWIGAGAISYAEFDEPFVVDASRAERVLGLRATPLALAVEETVRWYREPDGLRTATTDKGNRPVVGISREAGP